MANKRPRAKELRGLPKADIQTQLTGLQQELWQHRQKTKEGAQLQMHQIPAMRRQIARIHTVLSEQRQPASTGSSATNA